MKAAVPLLFVAVLAAGPAVAAGAKGAACRDEILAAARRHGVPEAVALTVARVESGGDPLAMNIQGWPAWAHSATDAVNAVRKLRAAGVTSIDVGCMQINLKHHPTAFPRLEDAFDPKVNVDYGVRFLKRLHAEKRSWGKAIASYHSSDPARQKVYLRTVLSKFSGLSHPHR
ncbi:MAG: transglycosylase SLT domain-containing protein [Pseudomonadota bacterium]